MFSRFPKEASSKHEKERSANMNDWVKNGDSSFDKVWQEKQRFSEFRVIKPQINNPISIYYLESLLESNFSSLKKSLKIF